MEKKTNIPKLRFPEFEGEWVEKKLGDKCDFEQGVQIDLQFQINQPKENYVKFLRIENYTQDSPDFRYIPINQAGKKRISKNEIVVVRYGASAGFVSRGFEGVLANNLFKVMPNSKILDLDYLYVFLKSYKTFFFFQTEMTGGAMPALNFEIVKALKISYSSLFEQIKIASFLTAVDDKLTQLTKKKSLLEEYKKGVMQKIFSQELRFKDDNGEDFPEWEEKTLGEVANKISDGIHSTPEYFENGDYYFINGNNLVNGKIVIN